LKAKKEKTHETYVRRVYGLAPGEYTKILENQGGACGICGKTPRTRFLAVDHDHNTGKTRGLLCYFCNTAIGVFEFDKRTATRASEYLKTIAANLQDASLPIQTSIPLLPSSPLHAETTDKSSLADIPF
jgi:hypothetical protein